jgi:hypothetical protein
MRNLHKLQKDDHILGLTNIVFEKDRPCGACQARKQVGTHHHGKNIVTTARPLKILHMDLFCPVAYISIGGNKYGLVIIDDYSLFTWVFFLQDKSETQEVIKKFLRTQNEFDAKVKKIRSDNDTEFKNTQVEDFLDEEGISMNFWPLILLNKMGWSKGRTVLSLRWQESCLMNTRPRIGFGWRRSTRRVMQLTTSTSTIS